MKRTLTAIITIVLVSLICVSFSSCGEKNQINTHWYLYSSNMEDFRPIKDAKDAEESDHGSIILDDDMTFKMEYIYNFKAKVDIGTMRYEKKVNAEGNYETDGTVITFNVKHITYNETGNEQESDDPQTVVCTIEEDGMLAFKLDDLDLVFDQYPS